MSLPKKIHTHVMTTQKFLCWVLTFSILGQYSLWLLRVQGRAYAAEPSSIPLMIHSSVSVKGATKSNEVCYLSRTQLETLRRSPGLKVVTIPWQGSLGAVEVNDGLYGKEEVTAILRAAGAGAPHCGRQDPQQLLPLFLAHIS